MMTSKFALCATSYLTAPLLSLVKDLLEYIIYQILLEAWQCPSIRLQATILFLPMTKAYFLSLLQLSVFSQKKKMCKDGALLASPRLEGHMLMQVGCRSKHKTGTVVVVDVVVVRSKQEPPTTYSEPASVCFWVFPSKKYDPIVSTDDEKKSIFWCFFSAYVCMELKVGFRKLRKKWGSSKDLISPSPLLLFLCFKKLRTT